LKNYLKTSDLRNKEDAKHFSSDLLLIFQNCRARVGNGKPASLSNKNYTPPKSFLLERKQKSALLRDTAVYSGAGATYLHQTITMYIMARTGEARAKIFLKKTKVSLGEEHCIVCRKYLLAMIREGQSPRKIFLE
jgi:hypothetical protein